MWKKHIKYSYFREDLAYAGKDFTKNNKTFIALAEDIELRGFKSIKAAQKAADKKWPLQK